MRKQDDGSPDHQLNRIDAALLDVIAQVEAMLRCGRAVQKGILRVRTTRGDSDRRKAIAEIRHAAAEIARHYRGADEIVRDLHAAADALE